MKDKKHVMIDGVPAVSFASSNAQLGETREIWHLNKGLLYEVTSYKELDSWLLGTLKGWTFI